MLVQFQLGTPFMKPYGYSYKKLIKLVKQHGSGCFLCTQTRKKTKKVERRKVKIKLRQFQASE